MLLPVQSHPIKSCAVASVALLVFRIFRLLRNVENGGLQLAVKGELVNELGDAADVAGIDIGDPIRMSSINTHTADARHIGHLRLSGRGWHNQLIARTTLSLNRGQVQHSRRKH